MKRVLTGFARLKLSMPAEIKQLAIAERDEKIRVSQCEILTLAVCCLRDCCSICASSAVVITCWLAAFASMPSPYGCFV